VKFTSFQQAVQLLRFTRSDSTLLVTPLNKLWSARLCRAGRVYRCELDDRECLALLAAWQSPVPAPELSVLGDYD
jgi:hypothetical protein